MSRERNKRHRMRIVDARAALLQIATGRMKDLDSIKRTAKRVHDALPDRAEWDEPGETPAGPPLVDGIPFWSDEKKEPKAPEKKKGGRPKGSKNKPKVEPGGVL
jgi:hypothetical protein